MKLRLQRDRFTDTSTIGTLLINGEKYCYTLEDKDRKLEAGGEKVYGKTAIPRGTYEVIIDFSNRYNKEMPHVLNVPGYEGIRIHSGNTSKDTDGCILVGSNRGQDWVGNSRATFAGLMEKLEAAYSADEKIELEIA